MNRSDSFLIMALVANVRQAANRICFIQWIIRDLNPGPIGYEPTALTNWIILKNAEVVNKFICVFLCFLRLCEPHARKAE